MAPPQLLCYRAVLQYSSVMSAGCHAPVACENDGLLVDWLRSKYCCTSTVITTKVTWQHTTAGGVGGTLPAVVHASLLRYRREE